MQALQESVLQPSPPSLPVLAVRNAAILTYWGLVDVMRCTNQGASYGGEDIEWSCTASLPEEFKLGSTEVTCEGYRCSSVFCALATARFPE